MGKISAGMTCQQLLTEDFTSTPDAPTQLESVSRRQTANHTVEYCSVHAYVVPQVGITLRLPDAWNRRFLQIGCGGHCGTEAEELLSTKCDDALRSGYACITSDMGHSGTGSDGLWGLNNLQTKVDWGFRATHVAALAGKAIVERYYTQPSAFSYFLGCSTGGRQALQEAQRFPYDFDGIVAGAPPVRLSMVYLTFAWGIRATHDETGRAIVGHDQLKLVQEAALSRCDMDDGVKDGVIGDPLNCHPDLSRIACGEDHRVDCLTAAQMKAVEGIYAGPVTSHGKRLSLGGPLPGSELPGWEQAYTGLSNQPSSYLPLVEAGFRYLLFPYPDPKWTIKDLNFDQDYRRFEVMQTLYDSSNPDLREFKQAGGKLIIFQGMNDNSVLPRSTIDYFETVQRTMGGRKETNDFLRLYLLPGVAHCSGGPGADAADFLGYLEKWKEQGSAPDRIVSAHLDDNSEFAYPYREYPRNQTAIKFTRPVFPYPQAAKYRGKGDPNNADSFYSVIPRPK